MSEELPVLSVAYVELNEQTILPNAYVSIVKSDKSKVSDITKDDVETMVNKAIELAGGLDNIISDGDVVILKPNIVLSTFLGDAIPVEGNGMVTDWRVAAAVAKAVWKLNPGGTIILMEGTAGNSTLEAFEDLNFKASTIPEIDEFIAIEESSGAWHDYGYVK